MKKFQENILFMVIGILISITFSYVLAANLMDSKDVYYKDNSGLGFNNVQDAIDGTCTKFSEKVATFLDKIYPVGSIYITTTLETASKVKEALGGKWEAYGVGKTLLSSDGKSEQTGGSNTVKLQTTNLPSHNHSFTPAGSISSTFTGTAVNSGTQSANHTHSTTATAASYSLKADSNGAHSHTYNLKGISPFSFAGGPYEGHAMWIATPLGLTTNSAGAHEHSISGSITVPAMTTGVNSANHYHSVTAAGTVSSTFTGTASNTGATGDGTSFSVQNEYITVYMYKRVE